MSLLRRKMERCVMLRKTEAPEGYGGQSAGWADGDEFEAAVVLDSSTQAKTAQSAGATGMYTVTTRRAKVLKYHEVFRRKSDGKIFRVTSDGDDRLTPESAGLDMRQVTAEEWRLPNG